MKFDINSHFYIIVDDFKCIYLNDLIQTHYLNYYNLHKKYNINVIYLDIITIINRTNK